MRACLLLLPLLAACGSETLEHEFELPGIRRISVRAHSGTVRLRTGAAGRTVVRAEGSAPAESVRVTDSQDTILVEVAEDARDPLQLDILAPEGSELTAACGDASVELTGKWGAIVVRTTHGDVRAYVESVRSGSIESQGGTIEFAPSDAGPEGDFVAKSLSGDVSLQMPQGWRGRLHLSTQSGKLDVPPHPNLRTTWDESGRSLLGFIGPALTEEDRAAELEAKGSPTAVWGNSATGDVSLRIGD